MCGRRRMNRTQIHNTVNPNRNAPAPAIASITRGLVNLSATSAPSHRPTCEAAHAHPGVSSHPRTSNAWAIHLGTVRYPLRLITIREKITNVTRNPTPAPTGKAVMPPSPKPSAPPTPPPSGASASDVIAVLQAAAARPAVTIPPSQASSVPSIHQIGRYHQVLPPPTASHVQGKALNGRSRTISIAMNTIVPHSPIAAALATPCTVRAVAK